MTTTRRTVAYIAVLLILVPMPCFGADLPAGPAVGGVAPEICFPLPDGERMLKDLEALPPCREAVMAAEEVIKSNKIKARTMEDRIAEQDREISGAKKTIDDTRKAGEEAAKAAGGAWYSRALSVLKWVGIGVLIGFVGAAAK